ncbi:MAG: putative glyoxalase/bleomycin resistance protein [Gemmatimonadota bacterium]|nr:MAG: putative glyoxalase/bleomycin resistance protein [Gemmatimonadota bacterium]
MPARKDFAPGEFCWIDLMAHDMEAAAAWYNELFGWTHLVMESPGDGPPYAFFFKGEAGIGGLGQMDDAMKSQGVPPMWNSYVCTADCQATEARVQELGGTVTVPTMEVPGFGKLAFFLDPEGASFAAWQTIGDGGHGVLVQEPGGMSWHELMTRDSAKASSFYGKLFGWEFAAMPMAGVDYTMVKNAGKDAAGFMPMSGDQFEGIPAHWLVYFAVEDCDAIAAKAAATGGRIHVPPTEIPVGKFSVLGDPQGGGFAVVQLKG